MYESYMELLYLYWTHEKAYLLKSLIQIIFDIIVFQNEHILSQKMGIG